MKKYLVLLVCCVMLALVGCGNKKFVGEWEVSKVIVADVEMPLEGMDADEIPNIVINKDGTAKVAGEDFTWEADGDVITFFVEGEEFAKASLIDGNLELAQDKLDMKIIYSKK